eukprot:403332529
MEQLLPISGVSQHSSTAQAFQQYCPENQTVNVANFLAQTEDYKGAAIKYMLDQEKELRDDQDFLRMKQNQRITPAM